MIRFLALLAFLTLATPAFAADDGGFGTKRFSNQGPAALDEGTAFDPSTVEPAAGTEEPDVTPAPDDAAATGTAPSADDATDPATEDATDSPAEE